MALRAGRPSVIDDDNINTQAPPVAPIDGNMDIEVFSLMIRHAQIASQISRRVTSVEAFRQSFDQAREAVHDIHEQLYKLLDSVPADLKVETLERRECLSTPRRVHAIYLHFAIYGSLMAAHVIFFYPWIAARFDAHSDAAFQEQVLASSEVVANAARQILLVVPALHSNISTPSWLAFHYPMYAHINLLVYLLRYPSQVTTSGDLSLLYVCAGHFGTLEHTTSSEISFHFPRESAALCSMFMKTTRFKENNNPDDPATPQAGSSTIEGISANQRPNDALTLNEPSMLSLSGSVVRLLGT